MSHRFRGKRDRYLKMLIDEVYARNGHVRLLDLGGRHDFWTRLGEDYVRSRNVHITILNLTLAEAREGVVQPDWLAFAVGDATRTEYPDHAFDVVMSNSVVEHLTTWDAMIAFADETRRLAPTYYCQTPNFWFPVDPHYFRFPLFHWLPRPTRAWLLQKFPIATAGRITSVRKAYAVTDYARLLSRPQMRDLFPDAQILRERFLLLFTKSWIAIRVARP